MVPAIAVADALRAEGAEVSFVGGQRAEAELVPAAGYPLDPIRVEGISRTNPLKALRAVAKAALALRGARAILRRRRADAVLGGGGYVAGPVGARRRATPRAARADGGRLAHGADEPPPGRPRPARLPRVPDRRARRAATTRSRAGPCPTASPTARPRAPRSGIGEDERCVLVFGGSLGARSVNEAAVAAFADAPYRVLHVAGRRDFPALTAPGPHYDLRDYLVPFGQALAAADLAVARAGGSVFELAQYGLPAVLVPYPHATADHQSANARWMAEGGAAVVLRDDELTPERLRSRRRRDPARPRAAGGDGRRLRPAGPAGRRARRRAGRAGRRRRTRRLGSGPHSSISGRHLKFRVRPVVEPEK